MAPDSITRAPCGCPAIPIGSDSRPPQYNPDHTSSASYSAHAKALIAKMNRHIDAADTAVLRFEEKYYGPRTTVTIAPGPGPDIFEEGYEVIHKPATATSDNSGSSDTSDATAKVPITIVNARMQELSLSNSVSSLLPQPSIAAAKEPVAAVVPTVGRLTRDNIRCLDVQCSGENNRENGGGPSSVISLFWDTPQGDRIEVNRPAAHRGAHSRATESSMFSYVPVIGGDTEELFMHGGGWAGQGSVGGYETELKLEE